MPDSRPRWSRAATGPSPCAQSCPPSRALALASRVRASLHLAHRDCAEALVWAEKARTLAEQCADSTLLAAVYVTIGTAWLFLEYARGCEHLHRGLDVARDAGLECWVANMYGNRGAGSGALSAFRRAERFLAAGIASATEHD
jgi:hypothetical protein